MSQIEGRLPVGDLRELTVRLRPSLAITFGSSLIRAPRARAFLLVFTHLFPLCKQRDSVDFTHLGAPGSR